LKDVKVSNLPNCLTHCQCADIGEMTDGSVTKLKFYLAEVETFEEPCVVAPNIGGTKNSYFWPVAKSRWSERFFEWLQAPHRHDEQEDLTAMESLEEEE